MIETVKYQAIYDYLVNSFATELKPGDKVLSERELCEKFGVSRMTVRQAIGELVAEGKLERIQGKGTFVAHEKLDLQLRITSFSQEMRMRGMVPATRVLNCEERTPTLSEATVFGLKDGQNLYAIRRLRFADETPMCVEVALLPAHLLPGFIIPHPPEGIYAELDARGYSPTWGEDVIESIVLDEDLTNLLEVEPGAAGLLVNRRAYADHQLICLTKSFYRGDRHKLWVPIAQPFATVSRKK
ncbi:GntR family transcriptional regulator [Gleimia sp. 6138-11-ORH1]|uniref:GntR family transcriptional regulator n=1 Tax=Gleimia sp. 6138-11-ORH1 TaxID=2973937 RepID=UPI002168EDB7|nr:GntR family transcriptional regulator [Gleimia sp. 6138-11-ORH1]MCS4484806.1 GntR family transcriptional regulator [Gleimia sp. 6138-11-ORH1]